MNFDFRRGIVYLNNSEKVNMFDYGVDSLEIYYDNEEATCNDRLFNYSRPVQHVILKCDCLEFNIKYIFTFADDEFMKILKSFFKIKESIYRIKKMIGDSYNVINNTINELKRYFLVIDRSEFYMEGTYYKYVIE